MSTDIIRNCVFGRFVIDSNRMLLFLPTLFLEPIHKGKLHMTNDDYTKTQIDRIWAAVQKNGVSASSVADGTVILFTRKFLETLLEKYPTEETISLHIKREASN
jgi:hypothetical protein